MAIGLNGIRGFTAESARHRWEEPLVALAWTITVSTVVAAAIVGTASTQVHWPLLASALACAILAGPFFLTESYRAARIRTSAVQIDRAQLPEIFARYTALARATGLTPAPTLYVMNGAGAMSSAASGGHDPLIVVSSDVLDLFYVHHDTNTLDFVLAHELAHHRLGHCTPLRRLIGVIPRLLVLPGRALSRAEDYSADRFALCICASADGVCALNAGKRTYLEVVPSVYLAQCEADAGPMARIVNALSRHPPPARRYRALQRVARQGLSQHAPLF